MFLRQTRSTRCAAIWLMTMLAASARWTWGQTAAPEAAVTQPADVFDLRAIQEAPLDARTLSTATAEGLVTEEVEFTSDHAPDGTPVRTFGILCYPEGGKHLPAIMWGQSGMSPASAAFPARFARKGYISLSITLDLKTWKSGAPFDTVTPRNANLTRLAIAHMRGITYLAARPETDKERIGVGGSSYGGLYANMVAAVDPRVKAGMSFFAGGHHELGSNLPQFLSLTNRDQIEVFRHAANADAGLARRAVPFIWGVPANDHWFHLPAVVQTCLDSIGEKRLAIMPLWAHAFPAGIDQELIDWFDIYLAGTRKPYNQPGILRFENREGRLIGMWTWTGANPVRKADLVVGYGRLPPWHGWVNRYYLTIPATVNQESAHAEIPVPEPDLDIYAFGNLYDDHDVLVSTMPVAVVPSAVGIARATARPVLNTFPGGGFEADDQALLKGMAINAGAEDPAQAHGGKQSARFQKAARMKLLFIPGHRHTLSLWLKAGKAVELTVQIVPGMVARAPAIKAILASLPGASPTNVEPAPSAVDVQAGPDWQYVALENPDPGVAVSGYELVITPPKPAKGQAPITYWVDDVRFEPQWH